MLISALKSPRDTRSAGANPTTNATSNDTSGREQEHVRIDRQRAEPRQVRGADGLQQLDRARGETEAEDSAHGAQDEALGHELAKHAPPARADRLAQRELARPNHAAREQQVRHVDAGDQEKDRRRSGHDQQRRSQVADDVLEQRSRDELERPAVRPRRPSRPAKTSSSA